MIRTGLCLFLLAVQSVSAQQDLSSHSGGVIVHVGCGNGSLLRQIGTNESFFTIGLDTNISHVAVLRETLRDEGFGGQVLVDEWNGTDLPFIDNFVNALILQEPCNVSSSEVYRVLVPNGTVYRLQGASWIPEIKPRPDEMDEWTHWDYSAANNRCSRDLLVGPLRRMQWYVWPFWTKHHFSSPAVQFIVSGGGRMFYVVDESPASTIGGGFPEKYALIARDAFNGKLLWRRTMGAWGMASYNYPGFFDGSVANPGLSPRQQRRFAVDGNRFYGVLEYNGPVVEMDGASGEILHTFVGTETCEEVYCYSNRLYVRNGSDPELMVFDPDSGGLIWSNSSYNPALISINNNRLCLLSGSTIRALDAMTFQEQWLSSGNSETVQGWRKYLIDAGPVVITRGASSWLIFRASDGQFLWSYPIATYTSPGDVTNPDQIFATTNLIWTFKDDLNMIGLDPLTGTTQKLVNATNVFCTSHHHRCHDDRATDRFFISAQEGVEMTSLMGETNQIHNWMRASCNVGSVPANGLLYVPPAACACVYNSMLHGLYSYAPAAPDAGRQFAANERLATGAAYGLLTGGAANSNDWPVYRFDSQRKSSTTSFVPQELQPMWETGLGGELTAPVIAGGRLFVASRINHIVYALDANTGSVVWKYAAGGEIDSPPSVWGDGVIFGCADGRVYCLRAADGALAWRFQAAPRDCRNMQLENVTSVWPVPGSVLLDNGAIYFSAGHSSRLDGGIQVYKLDALTGAVLATNRVFNVSPDVPAPANLGTNDEEGIKNDLLVSDGSNLFLREAVFTTNLAATTSTRTDHMVSAGNRFLDSSWHHRQAWLYNTIFAQYLCADTQNVYGIKAHTKYKQWESFAGRYQPGSGYILFAQNISNKGATAIAESGVENETRPQPMTQHVWWQRIPLRIQAMVRAGDFLFAAGQPDVFDRDDPFAAFEGRAGGSLWTVDPDNGERLAEYSLTSPPVFDGLAAAENRLYLSTMDGSVLCLGQPESAPAAEASVDPAYGTTATMFTLDGTGSRDLDGRIVSYEWKINGSAVSTNTVYTASFGTVGVRTVQLTVTDDDGMTGTDTAALSVTSPATDSDGDGLPDSWETAHAGNLSMSPGDHNDSDGLTALEEYVYGTNPFSNDSDDDGLADNLEIIAGTDPANADSLFHLSGEPLSGGQMRLAWDSVENRTYSIWGSSNLVTGFTELIAHHLTATPPVNTFVDTASRTNGVYFYRLQVTKSVPEPLPNAAPVAVDDEAFTAISTPAVISVLDNDSDPDFQALTVQSTTDGAHGTVSHTAVSVTYTPQTGWTGTDTFSYTIEDEPGGTATGQVSVQVRSGANLVADPSMQQAHPEDDSIGTANAGAGWTVGTLRAWQWDRNSEWSFAFCGSDRARDIAMAQVIADGKATKGTQSIEFRAVHQGSGDTLQVRVYGVNGPFTYAPKNTSVSTGTLLYDSGNVAVSEFDWMTFAGSANFGSSGYDYIVIIVFTDGIVPNTDEFIAIDSVYLGP